MSQQLSIRAFALTLCAMGSTFAHAQPLASLEHHVTSAKLQVSPQTLHVPKNIPGSLAVDLVSASGLQSKATGPLSQGTHIEAVLRGPAFPAYRLLGLPNEPLVLPPLSLLGDYQIDDIRLVHTQSGQVLMMASPKRVTVHVFEEVLVSQVTARPLSLQEIQDRNIVIDADSFSALEFEATFMVEGQPYPVRFPVVTPKFKESTEIIPAAELQERLVEAEAQNRALAQTLQLPADLSRPRLDLQIQGLNFQYVPPDGYATIDVPPIPGLVVIPGNVGFLNQFFSVQVFTANASPGGSALTVHSLEAELSLPDGPDMLPSTADDPVAFAVVQGQGVQSRLPIKTVGVDGQAGTADDQGRLLPGQSGQAEFLVEGKRPGLHKLDIKLSGILDGFAHGEVPIVGHATGSVLVRNPSSR